MLFRWCHITDHDHENVSTDFQNVTSGTLLDESTLERRLFTLEAGWLHEYVQHTFTQLHKNFVDIRF